MTTAKLVSNAGLVRRWFEEVWGQRKLETIDELLTGNSLCHAEQGAVSGPEQFKREIFQPLTSAFPDLDIQLDDILEVGENVVVRWTVAATHTGDALGFPASGERVHFAGITWVQIKDGKFVEGWQSSNIPLVIGQLASRQRA